MFEICMLSNYFLSLHMSRFKIVQEKSKEKKLNPLLVCCRHLKVSFSTEKNVFSLWLLCPKIKVCFIKETFKKQEKDITGMPAEPPPSVVLVVSSSPLWCNISIVMTSAAVIMRGGAGCGGGPKDMHCSDTGSAAEHGRLFMGSEWQHPGLTGFLWQFGPPCHYSLITKSAPHRGSECWPPQPAGEGHWTRFCKDSRARLRM